MEELLGDFLAEASENLERVDAELVAFEREPSNAAILGDIFRLVHSIKGACGFLGLERLEALTHAAETLVGQFRDGRAPTVEAVSAILAAIDRIKIIVAGLSEQRAEPAGADDDVISRLARLAASGDAETQARTERELAEPAFGSDDLEALLGPYVPPASADKPAETAHAAEMARAFPEPLDVRSEPAVPLEDGEADAANAAARSLERATIRVAVDTVEHLMTMVSELVLTRNQLLEFSRRAADNEIAAPLQRLSAITGELQNSVIKARMQPISRAVGKLHRVVRDVANDLGKQVRLVAVGVETELDRSVLDLVSDPLVHMVRNAVDHGIETPGERLAAGKPALGTIRISASQEGGTITLEIADDGRGVPVERVRQKAVERGMLTPETAARMADEDLLQLIFAPGFSTAASLSTVSGRGVGMDVVRHNVEAAGGSIALRSVAGAGTTLRVKLPLTLAIMGALVVEAGGERFALPQGAITELVGLHGSATAAAARDATPSLAELSALAGHTGPHGAEAEVLAASGVEATSATASGRALESVNGALVLRWRDRLVPVLDLARELKLEGAAGPSFASASSASVSSSATPGPTTPGSTASSSKTPAARSRVVALIEARGLAFGLLVDAVTRTEEIVVKPMASRLRSIPHFAGSTMLGDGALVLILDPSGLARAVDPTGEAAARDDFAHRAEAAPDSGREATAPMLLLRAGAGGLYAVPLSLVVRLEEIAVSAIDVFDPVARRGRTPYRGRILPLVALGDARLDEGGETAKRPVLVVGDEARATGLVVDAILDIVEAPRAVDREDDAAGTLGSVLVDGRVVDVVDIADALERAHGPFALESRSRARPSPSSRADAPRLVAVAEPDAFLREVTLAALAAAGVPTLVCADLAALRRALEPSLRAEAGPSGAASGASLLAVVAAADAESHSFAALAQACRTGGVPVIATVSDPTDADADAALRLGAEAALAKFDRRRLVSALGAIRARQAAMPSTSPAAWEAAA